MQNPYTADDIQLVLTFSNAAAFDQHFHAMEAVSARIRAAMLDLSVLRPLAGIATPSFMGAMDSNDRFHFTVERFDNPMQLDGFADVLANPFIQNSKSHLIEAVVNHQRALLVTIGAGPVMGIAKAFAASGFASDIEAMGLPFDFSQESYEERLLVAQIIGKLLVSEMMPTAVHWVQSQQLFDGQTFVEVANDGFNLPLYVAPFVYGCEELPDGKVKAGIRGLGSQNLLGKMVIFRPSPEPWPDSYKMILTFVAYCRSIGRILGPNETMSWDTDDAKVIRIAHKNDIPQLKEGYIELHVDPVTPVHSPDRYRINAETDNLVDAFVGKRNTLAEKSKGKPVVHPADIRGIQTPNSPVGSVRPTDPTSTEFDWIRDTIQTSSPQRGVFWDWTKALVWPTAFILVMLAFNGVLTQTKVADLLVPQATNQLNRP